MTWSRMLGFLLAAAGLRWVAGHLWPNADAYVLAGAALLWLIVAVHRRTRGYGIADALNHATDQERETLLAKLTPAPAPQGEGTRTLTLEEALTDTLRFTYPKGSRSFTTFQFWLCIVFGGGLLLPLALGRVTDPSDSWILFLLGSLLVLAGLGHRRRLRWLRTEVALGPDGLTMIDPRGRARGLTWAGICTMKQRVWVQVLEFETPERTTIRVWPELIAYSQFVALAKEHLRVARGRAI